MLTRRSVTHLLASTAIVASLGAPAAADWRNDISVIRIATAASDDEAARRARYEPVAAFLSERLGVDVELIVTSEHAATAEAFLNGFVEVADMGTQAYAIMAEQAPGSVRPFATQLNEDGSMGALLHKSGDKRMSPIPGRTHPTASVTGMPSAVKPFSTATRIWNSAT